MSSGNGTSTAASRAEQVERRRAERDELREQARTEQYAKDLEAIEALEGELGLEIDIVKLGRFKDGLPSVVGLRTPDASEYKRYFQSVQRAGNADAKMMAFHQLGDLSWVYPADEATKKAMVEAHPAVRVVIANRAVKLAEQHAADEGKG